MAAETFRAPVSDDAVKARTGRTWNEWIAVLDGAGAATRSHSEIVGILGEQFGIGAWWRQMVTVGYERARGLRAVHETTRGFSVSVSRTIDAPLPTVFGAWSSAARRRRWLDGSSITVRSARPEKSMRITWGDGTNVEVNFAVTSSGKSRVSVQHDRLASARAVAERRRFWKERLDRLVEQLAARSARASRTSPRRRA